MHLDEQRRAENFALTCPLKHINDGDMLAFLATLIQDHDHMREKLLTEPDRSKWAAKIDAMRPHLKFNPDTADHYYQAELARQCGVQPIYAEQERAEAYRLFMPESRIHEVRE